MSQWIQTTNANLRSIKVDGLSDDVWFTDQQYSEVTQSVADLLAAEIDSISKVSEPGTPGDYYESDYDGTTLNVSIDSDPGPFSDFTVTGTVSAGTVDSQTISTESAEIGQATAYLRDGATGNDVQAEIDALSSQVPEGGYGVVHGPATAVEVSSSISVPSNVYLNGFHFKLADGANTTVLKTKDFDSLTGSNAWFVDTDGVPHNFGFKNILIDGNAANNDSGSGIEIFGKRYLVENVVIHSFKDKGFYSEAGAQGGQNDWRDMPECRIRGLYIKACGTHNFHYRGPHDGLVHELFSASSGGYGVLTEVDTNYNGDLEIDFLHSYSNANGQLYQANIKTCNRLIVDNEHCQIDNSFNINQMALVNGVPSVTLNSGGVIGVVKGRCSGSPTNDAFRIEASNVGIGSVYLESWPTNGLVIDANNVTVSNVHSFDNGEYNIKLGDTTSVKDCRLHFSNINSGGTAGFYYNGGGQNWVTGSSYISSGFTGYETNGSKPSTDDHFDIDLRGAGTGLGKSRVEASASVADGGTITHGLIGQPRISTIHPTNVNQFGGWSARDSTNITVALTDETGSPIGSAQPVEYRAIY